MFIVNEPFGLICICNSYRTVQSTISDIFSEFWFFGKLFSEPLGEENKGEKSERGKYIRYCTRFYCAITSLSLVRKIFLYMKVTQLSHVFIYQLKPPNSQTYKKSTIGPETVINVINNATQAWNILKSCLWWKRFPNVFTFYSYVHSSFPLILVFSSLAYQAPSSQRGLIFYM